MDLAKLKPFGPWILVKVDPPPEKTAGGLYRPQGNAQDRMGQATGTVLRVGQGRVNSGKQASKHGKFEPSEIKPGIRIVFRGYLQEANRPGGVLDREHSLVHINDVIGEVLDTDWVV